MGNKLKGGLPNSCSTSCGDPASSSSGEGDASWASACALSPACGRKPRAQYSVGFRETGPIKRF